MAATSSTTNIHPDASGNGAAGAVAPDRPMTETPATSAVHLLLDVEGMKCGGCVSAVERRLLEQSGVRSAGVNLVTRTAWVALDPDQPAAVDQLTEALKALGFPASLRSADRPGGASPSDDRDWWHQWRSLTTALALMVFSGFSHLAMVADWPLPLVRGIGFHALVATLAMALPGRRILVGGSRALLHGVPTMDTLVGLGMGSAYLASMVALLWPQVGWDCFFNEAVMLLSFVLLGRWIEERARRRTGQALEQLSRLQPDEAQLLVGNEAGDTDPRTLLTAGSRPVHVGALRPGDRLRVLPGDRIPVDGQVLAGCSSVDLSSLTGEPLPEQIEAGDQLAAGSLNLSAPLVLLVERSGEDTTLARIIRMVAAAQARKAPIQRLADRIAGRFVYVVMTLATFTFLFWWQIGGQRWPGLLATSNAQHHLHGAAMDGMTAATADGVMAHGLGSLGLNSATPLALATQLAIAVLVVACPCALGLATPTAITVGSGRGAKAGILFRGGDVIEVAAQLQTVVFDKTGTLTLGRPLLKRIERSAAAAAIDESTLLQWAASLEQHTRHPLAHALLQAAQSRNLPLLEVMDGATHAGDGVRGTLAGAGSLLLGRPDWLRERGVAWPEQASRQLDSLVAAGDSVLALARDNQLLALMVVADRTRPDARPTLERLGRLGLSLELLSGDRRANALHLAAEVGIPPEAVRADVRPEQKGTYLNQLRAQGLRVAMVGDGINDAPALAEADLGIAVGTGTQIAQDTADLVVMGEGLGGIADALQLARATMAKVRQNLFWAFAYNLLALPVAAGALLPSRGLVLLPPVAALLMALSSITVVINALMLNWRPHRHDFAL